MGVGHTSEEIVGDVNQLCDIVQDRENFLRNAEGVQFLLENLRLRKESDKNESA